MVGAALLEITEALAGELNDPTSEPPPWDDFEWCIAQAVLAIQGVACLLSKRLMWEGPDSWTRFLREQRDHIAGRHRNIVRLLDRIDSSARREGISLVALKGAELHRRGIYEAGERPMADIDLLVRDADVNVATRLLKECGYTLTFTTWRHGLFELPLTKIADSARLDRVLPTRETRNELNRFATHHPGASELPWYGVLML